MYIFSASVLWSSEFIIFHVAVNHKEAVTIPKGCVLAFRVRQLMVKGKDEWGEHVFPCRQELPTHS